VAKSHQSVNWDLYFLKIQEVCPWSMIAWHKGKIDIVKTKTILPLGDYRARIYIFNLSRRRLKKLCKQRDQGECEWLWSHPTYGDNGTPLPCLIQQSRHTLTQLRNKHSPGSKSVT
jgi:hypothetical protein